MTGLSGREGSVTQKDTVVVPRVVEAEFSMSMINRSRSHSLCWGINFLLPLLLLLDVFSVKELRRLVVSVS